MSALHKGGTLKSPSPDLEPVDVINEDLNDITEQGLLTLKWMTTSAIATPYRNFEGPLKVSGQRVVMSCGFASR
ncbi:hypothetical protein AVEN_143369-1 [Araneus ventricosus]|uniref:Uncharacterized protein n=1 Tax=Araneus ventricosus TaxID=182803 RepID=A0A4Y2AEN1_ARAVE|nr:hypothetical protein AVEN_143369-1 [Araneus ventricosus]